MKTRNLKSKVLWMLMSIAMVATTTFADDGEKSKAAQSECKSFFAEEHSALITTGCNSPVGFCAGGTFKGNHGFRGTSFFSAISFDPILNDPQGRQVVPGVSTYTADDGSITISDVSVFDVARGTFSGVGRIVQGTGRFAGATGDVFTAGRLLADGSFINELNADICVPK
jgi:hypothetical protein